ncbi:dentin sialophosphoprotein-like isoform X2 [Bradysia coprophila]|uniref:dentin sialophosphoprotein-like isoform X2 n=1 Tax=Bradysia coprophila TaxID=38358 RepID=UPI00187D82DA|nr:dentin sialophosphoprotein-like isoform X2 [Bradysia coprophila]
MGGFLNKMLDCMASTHLGQFAIKKIDLVLWSLEKPARYSADGEYKKDSLNLPWPIFMTILVNMQILRIICSTVSVHFNKGSIEPKDIVKGLQKWRRTLRSIRFRGLRVMRESQCGKLRPKNVPTSPSLKDQGKKRNHDEMLEHDLLDDLMNRTFSDTDNTDSTFMISKFGDISTNGSSNDGHSLSEDFQSPFKSKHSLDSSLQDTLPISASESEHQEPNMSTKSNEGTFVSTVDDTEESAFALTEEESGQSPNDNSKHSERNGSRSTESTVQTNGNSKVSKESLNAPVDPLDAMMFKLVEMESSEWKINNSKKSGKNRHGNKKKRNYSLTSSQENVNSQSSMKASKSQEAINKL